MINKSDYISIIINYQHITHDRGIPSVESAIWQFFDRWKRLHIFMKALREFTSTNSEPKKCFDMDAKSNSCFIILYGSYEYNNLKRTI